MRLNQYPIKGVIYDLDGTLVESSLNFKAMREAVNCPPHCDLLHYIEQISDETEQRQAMQLILDHEQRDALTAKVLPGALALVNWLKQQDIPQAIVTRNNKDAAKLKVSNSQLPIDLVISREQYPAKPDPAALIAIAKQWQLDCVDIVYIGDFKYDLMAANNANMVSCLINQQDADYQDMADLIFDDLHALTRAFKTSVLECADT